MQRDKESFKRKDDFIAKAIIHYAEHLNQEAEEKDFQVGSQVVLLMICILLIPTQTHAAGTNKKIEWKTKNKKVVKIISKTEKMAKIKAVKVGTTTITAKVGKKTYRCKIKVVNPKLSKSEISLKVDC